MISSDVFYVQSGEKSLYQVIIGEFYTFDLMEKHVKKTCRKIDLDCWIFKSLFFTLYFSHHEGKTSPRNHRSQPNNGKKILDSFNIADACVLTAT